MLQKDIPNVVVLDNPVDTSVFSENNSRQVSTFYLGNINPL